MIQERQLIAIFVEIDDFCKELGKHIPERQLTGPTQGKRGPACCISVSEIMTIQILFQMIGFRNFKTFYTGFLQTYWKQYFPNLPSYQRFVELINRALYPLTLFTLFKCGKKTGIYYIDGSCLPVCHLKRSKRNKVFDENAQYGKTSVGWFFGLKIHLVINNFGELIAFKITRGNVNDSVAGKSLLMSLKGLAFGDKGYIGKKLFDELLKKGLKLITRKRKNMKEKLALSSDEKQLLNQRNLIETVINCLKFKYHIWHTRHRSVFNAMTNLIAALAAYTIQPLKLSAIKLLKKHQRAIPEG
jgi:hypothetical protein